MSDTSIHKPDLEDGTNVSADAAVSAAKRENHMFSQGAEPISLWMIFLGAIIVLIAGNVIGGSLFDYKNIFTKGYVRGQEPGVEAGAVKAKPALEAYMKVGKKVYDSCAGCHQPNGEGNASYPPMAGSEWVNGEGLRPAMIILNGCSGPITVAGNSYNASMPSQGADMDAKKLAGILNFVRNSFGNKSNKLITMEMAQDALDTSKARNGGQMTADELNAKFKRELKGAALDPNTSVNPQTLEPVPVETAQ